MIKDLLCYLAENQSWPEAAERLHCSAEVLAAMLEQLERGGYVARSGAEGSCVSGNSTACQSCVYKKVCETKSHFNLWSLTEKGRQAAASAHFKEEPKPLI
ncbi:MAG: FeoC-like transcriptional regulator [Candidatus Bruticola sp.]